MYAGTIYWPHGKNPKQQTRINMIKVLSINVCLGLLNKITLARKWTTTLPIDVMFIQEAELTEDHDLTWLNIDGYDFYHTKMNPKARMAAYVKKDIKCK